MSLCRRTVLVAPLGYLAACAASRSYRGSVAADRTVRVPLAELDPDGFLTVTIGEDEVLLVREGEQVRALDLTCTHQGCAVAKRRDQLVCPCHGSRFDLQGAVLRGPATERLATYPVERDGDSVVIRL
jgi:cytochrome b6-f complex iron-sulfur subunit